MKVVMTMSKFTTEVRNICETYANDPSLSIEDTITKAKPYIFNDTWNTYEPDHKDELEQKILRFYYMREIGYETVSLWKFRLNTQLSLIMPKYNVLYSSLGKIKENLLANVDVTEERSSNDKNTNENTTHNASTATVSASGKSDTTNSTNGTTTNETTSKSDTTDNSKSTTEASNTGKTTSTGSSKNGSDAWQKYADTPQGGLQGLQNDTYLTNATHNLVDGNSSSDTTTDSSGSSNNTVTDEGTTSNTGSSNGTTTNKDSGETHSTNSNSSNTSNDGTTTQNGSSNHDGTSTMHMTGKNNGTSYLEEYTKLVNQYNDIDMQIVAELEPLFMGIWE